MSFGCERSCSSNRRVSNFNSKVPQGGIYPHIKFERDRLNIFRVRVFTSSGITGGRGGDAKTIISPNTNQILTKTKIAVNYSENIIFYLGGGGA